MNRLAIFVEGYTELIFVAKLIDEIAGDRVLIEKRRIRGGGKARRASALLEANQPETGQRYYVLIFDCGGDRLVKPRVQEEHENLTKKGYQRIIGLRDVRPDYSHATISDLVLMLPKYIKTKLIPVEFILAVLEVEAWFLTEATHFSRVDAAITVAAIKEALKFDPENDDMQQRLTPADDLSRCYALGGKTYRKGDAQATVAALDFSIVYLEAVKKLPPLKRLVDVIDDFLRS